MENHQRRHQKAEAEDLGVWNEYKETLSVLTVLLFVLNNIWSNFTRFLHGRCEVSVVFFSCPCQKNQTNVLCSALNLGPKLLLWSTIGLRTEPQICRYFYIHFLVLDSFIQAKFMFSWTFLALAFSSLFMFDIRYMWFAFVPHK